tara:strand:+ start:276 stop:455 length:180 start_codon:yes stop_codon:yes gene_type:complete
MNNLYTKGTYYEDLGTYLGVRKTHYVSKKYPHVISEHVFSTGVKDGGGAVMLNKLPTIN